jgi:aerobic carbon-monoxide dehydrogenase small subunit
VIIQFTLNGKNVTIEAEPLRRAVDLLREDFRMTGTKEGCGTGECGACTILVNGESKLSCLMPAFQLEGSHIVTIEGMSEDGKMHPLQEAFIAHGAIQCGFCTPGMVMAAADLLRKNPRPTREEIREGLSGNLCRCTGYRKIVDAVEAAALEMERGKDR